MSGNEKLTRRAMLFEQRVVPDWSTRVDTALLSLLGPIDWGEAPTVLVAECRTGHLVSALLPQLPEKARLMVVDPSSEMLDFTRKKKALGRSVFFSTQSMTKLSYANGVFHTVLCSNGLLTRTDVQLAGQELLRVLRPEGYLGVAIPLRNTFRAFQDMAHEALTRLGASELEQSLDAYEQALLAPGEAGAAFGGLGLQVLGEHVVSFDLSFENAEDFLFSPFADGLFLPRWLTIFNDPKQREAVFFDLVRSIDTYFRGVAFPVPVEVAIVVARR